MEQRAKVMGKDQAASIYRSYINSQKKKTKAMKEDFELQELFDLWEAEMNVVPKPQLQDEMPTSNMGPNSGNFEHPITQKRKQMDGLLGTGVNPVEAHKQVYGEVDTGDTESKKALAASLGRIQDDGTTSTVKLSKAGTPSILAKDS